MTPRMYTILYLILCTIYSVIPVVAIILMHGISINGLSISSEYSMIIAYSSLVPYALGIIGGILYADNIRKTNEQKEQRG